MSVWGCTCGQHEIAAGTTGQLQPEHQRRQAGAVDERHIGQVDHNMHRATVDDPLDRALERLGVGSIQTTTHEQDGMSAIGRLVADGERLTHDRQAFNAASTSG